MICPDRPGLVRELSGWVAANGGNIVHADHHSDQGAGLFLSRIEWQLAGFGLPREAIGPTAQALAERLETLAAAQGLAELTLQLVPSDAPVEGVLDDLLLQLNRLEAVVKERQLNLEALAIAVQGSVQLLALGGYALPLASCARSGEPLEPPLGNWEWRCSLLPSEGLVIGAVAGAQLVLNASELALLQRLLRPALPRRRDGELMGPEPVWLRLLQLVEIWSREHLGRSARSWRLLRQCYSAGPWAGASSEPAGT